MELKVVIADITKIDVDAVIVNLFEEAGKPGGATGSMDKALDGAISQLIDAGEIKGKLGEYTLIHTLGKIPAKRVVVAGLGKQQELTLDRIRRISAESCRFVRGKGVKRVAAVVHGAGVGDIEPEKAAQTITEGSLLGVYKFSRHLTKESGNNRIEELLIVGSEKKKLRQLERGCATGKIIAGATNFARDMINEPANFMTPTVMADIAMQLAAEYGLEAAVFGREKMREMGMGGLLGVAQGSSQEPKFIILKYKGDNSSEKTVGFVGKGLTFDSGGISIKPAEGMGDMKGDMSGGATVMAALQAIAQLKPKINITALIPATENLPSGTALKPGDVIKAMNGKTIEVVNTDAEGRLIMADALSYAATINLTPIVDIATLTGACHVALGDFATGAFTNNQEWLNKVIAAGAEASERLWQMPMYEEYKEQNKSDIADIKNSGGRYGGAITAAQFLSEFVDDIPWVHLDIAGTFMSDKERGYTVKGAAGVCVRTLINLAVALSKEQG